MNPKVRWCRFKGNLNPEKSTRVGLFVLSSVYVSSKGVLLALSLNLNENSGGHDFCPKQFGNLSAAILKLSG